MIANICLIVIFFCFLFMVMNRRVDLKWFAKGLMCVGMLTVVGVLSIPKHISTITEVLSIVIAFLTVYGTTLIYKRGWL